MKKKVGIGAIVVLLLLVLWLSTASAAPDEEYDTSRFRVYDDGPRADVHVPDDWEVEFKVGGKTPGEWNPHYTRKSSVELDE